MINKKLEYEKNREESIRKKVNLLSAHNRKIYYDKIVKELKDPDTYATLNFAFLIGLHNIYLKKYGTFLLNSLFIAGVICFFSTPIFYFFLILFLGIQIHECIQLFDSERIVLKYNNDVMEKIVKKLSEDISI